MEPDFESLASAWIMGDVRSQGADEETQKRIATRIAAALAERRRQVEAGPSQDQSLIVNIPSDHIGPDGRIDEEALAQLETFITEHQQMLDEGDPPSSPPPASE